MYGQNAWPTVQCDPNIMNEHGDADFFMKLCSNGAVTVEKECTDIKR